MGPETPRQTPRKRPGEGRRSWGTGVRRGVVPTRGAGSQDTLLLAVQLQVSPKPEQTDPPPEQTQPRGVSLGLLQRRPGSRGAGAQTLASSHGHREEPAGRRQLQLLGQSQGLVPRWLPAQHKGVGSSGPPASKALEKEALPLGRAPALAPCPPAFLPPGALVPPGPAPQVYCLEVERECLL